MVAVLLPVPRSIVTGGPLQMLVLVSPLVVAVLLVLPLVVPVLVQASAAGAALLLS